MYTLKIGSLFDGSGGFPLAGVMYGIEPVWASEIEKFPVMVTSKRFPNMVHLGDITKIDGAGIEPVDVITFGAPCQGLSVAGLQKGLVDERSGLFLEAVRIIKEMRSATNGRYPTYAVWENVPGAFSSNKGEDFYTVITEMCKIKDPNVSIPRPNKRKGKNAGLEWKDCGAIMGDGYSIAWRCLDAQFWGTPQRRKRIFLVADFRGQRANKVLFERESLSRYFTQGKNPWQGVAPTAEMGVGKASGFSGNNSITAGGVSLLEECSPTLQVKKDAHVMTIENHPADSRVNLSDDGIVQTLTSRMGTGGGNVPMVMQVVGIDAYNLTTSGNIAVTLTAQSGSSATHSGPMVMQKALYIAGNTIDRQPQNGGNGVGCQEDISYTLNTVDRHAIAYEQQAYDKYIETDTSATLKACGGNYGGDSESIIADKSYGIGNGQADQTKLNEEIVGALTCMHDQQAILQKLYRWIVRRLTPTECASLQGFPKWWCADISHSDSAEYKMWGNGVALPCVLYVMEGISEELRRTQCT